MEKENQFLKISLSNKVCVSIYLSVCIYVMCVQ